MFPCGGRQCAANLWFAEEALEFVRFRHTDSDLFRLARQQSFVTAMRQQVSHSLGPTSIPGLVNEITHHQYVEVARGVANEVIKLGATMVDAPVSGGVAGAKAGTLSFLVGGTKDAYERVSPILSRMGKRVMYCGPSGAGLAAKICNNMVLGVQQIAIAEAMLLGQKLGLEPAVLAGVINNSTGACWATAASTGAWC